MIHLPLWASLSDPWSKTPSLLSAVVTERGRWNARLTTACRVLINTSSPPPPCFWPCSRASDYMLTSLEHFLAPHLVLGWDGARTKAELLPVALHVTVLSSNSCAFLPPPSLVFISSSSWFLGLNSFLSTRRLLGWIPAFSFSLKSSDDSTGEYHSRSEDILEDVTWQWTAVFLINNFLQDFRFFWAGVFACEWTASEKRELNPLEPELQATVHNLGTELGSSANAVWALSHWEISPVPTALFLNVTVLPMTNTISLKANWSFKYLGWIQTLQWVQAGTETEMSWGLGKLFRSGTLSIHGAWFNTQYSKNRTPIPKKITENNVLE